MVVINYCPSCGCELKAGSFVCPSCELDFKDIIENRHLLQIDESNHSIEMFDGVEGEVLGESPIFEVTDDENNVEIVIDSEDLIGPDGMPREIPIEIFVDDADEDIQLELISEDGENSDIVIEQKDDGNIVIKPNISFSCPICGAPVGEDLFCKSCFTHFSLTTDNNE